FSSIYELPLGKGRKFMSRSPVRYLVGGWSVGAVGTIQTAAPFTVTTQTNTTNAFSSGALRADVLRNPNLASVHRTLTRWSDLSAVAQPAHYRFGIKGISSVRGVGKTNFDASILRNFAFSESKRLQFRGEIFNPLNHPTFGLAGHTLRGPGCGMVSGS